MSCCLNKCGKLRFSRYSTSTTYLSSRRKGMVYLRQEVGIKCFVDSGDEGVEKLCVVKLWLNSCGC